MKTDLEKIQELIDSQFSEPKRRWDVYTVPGQHLDVWKAFDKNKDITVLSISRDKPFPPGRIEGSRSITIETRLLKQEIEQIHQGIDQAVLIMIVPLIF